MKVFYRSISLFIVAFVAVVGFAPQAKALDVDDINRITVICVPLCSKLQECIEGVCVDPPTTCTLDKDCLEGEMCVRGICLEPVGCEDNDDCDDDGLFCNGAETCFKPIKGEPGTCVAGAAPCAGEICVEADDECIECEDDEDCADDETCEDDVCEAVCPYPPEAKDFDVDGNCLFSKEELKDAKTFYKNEHKDQKTDLKESQGADKALLKSLKEYAE